MFFEMASYCVIKILKTILKTDRSLSPLFTYARRCTVVSNQQIGEKYEPPLPKSDPVIDTKLLKVAIIGSPNAGKSTLINQIVERRVFAMSKKVHTTRCRAKAVHIEGNTQLVFLDTPGLVSASESQKFKLSQQFMTGGEEAIGEADVIGVVHDMSNNYTRNKLDEKVLRLLHLHQEKESFLILNKIDTIQSKRILLGLSEILTGGRLRNYKEPLMKCKITENNVLEMIKQKTCWNKFSDVFMVSALLGQGISDVKSYLLGAARPGKWIFGSDIFTDQDPVRIIEEAVRSKLLDHLPNEVPYKTIVELEYLDDNIKNGKSVAVVLITCSSPRIERLIMGSGGRRIKTIAKESEQALIDTFMTNFLLRLVVTCKQAK